MSVRAKFTCQKIEKVLGQKRIYDAAGEYVKDERGYPKSERCELWTVTLNPVYGNNDPHHENSKFWDTTPSGQILLGTVNEGAVSYFELGEEYYIDFSKCKEVVK